MEDEAKLVNHLKSVANYGYGYSRMEVVDLATDYGIQLGKRTKENLFTLNWFVKYTEHGRPSCSNTVYMYYALDPVLRFCSGTPKVFDVLHTETFSKSVYIELVC
jgi:hypothetical protein